MTILTNIMKLNSIYIISINKKRGKNDYRRINGRRNKYNIDRYGMCTKERGQCFSKFRKYLSNEMGRCNFIKIICRKIYK